MILCYCQALNIPKERLTGRELNLCRQYEIKYVLILYLNEYAV